MTIAAEVSSAPSSALDLRIARCYGPLDLKEMAFRGERHLYLCYDLSGDRLEEVPIDSLGSFTRGYDIASRPTSLTTAHFIGSMIFWMGSWRSVCPD